MVRYSDTIRVFTLTVCRQTVLVMRSLELVSNVKFMPLPVSSGDSGVVPSPIAGNLVLHRVR